jgi:tetratricopeptide (TPR) repeat protein
MLIKLRLPLFLAAAIALCGQERFDYVVRNDFFAGLSGNRAALDRAMTKCEEILAGNPKHAEAMVWHGAGTFYLSGVAAQSGDFLKTAELYKKGLDEMAAAVALAPDNVGVVIPRGAALLTASHSVPGDNGKELLRMGLADYEHVYQLQSARFDKLPGHARGELLFGLAEGYSRLGDAENARRWFEKLAAVDDPENGHLGQARAYLENGVVSGTVKCVGCHVGK